MSVQYTGRHYEVAPAFRKEVETCLTKIRKIPRERFETKAILATENHRGAPGALRRRCCHAPDGPGRGH